MAKFIILKNWQKIFLIIIPSIAVTVIGYLIFMKNDASYFKIGLTLIFSGALGNLIDRIRVGYVVDFIDFHISDFHWPAFNVADSVISVGVALIIFLEIRTSFYKREKRDKN